MDGDGQYTVERGTEGTGTDKLSQPDLGADIVISDGQRATGSKAWKWRFTGEIRRNCTQRGRIGANDGAPLTVRTFDVAKSRDQDTARPANVETQEKTHHGRHEGTESSVETADGEGRASFSVLSSR